MKLAFNTQARYTDFSKSYDNYVKRSRRGLSFDRNMYNRVIREYCKILADRLFTEGFVDLPKDMGSISAAVIRRKPQYRGKKFVGFGGVDYATGLRDGKYKTFGIVFLPKHSKNANLRCLGFVANKRLFRRMRDKYKTQECNFVPINFTEEMI